MKQEPEDSPENAQPPSEDQAKGEAEPNVHYVYVLQKKPDADKVALKYWQFVEKKLIDEYLEEEEELRRQGKTNQSDDCDDESSSEKGE